MSAGRPDQPPRKIIHVDMDAFYAAVEVLDRPELAGLPLVVGGKPDSRGVVATASYEARRFGIRSAMASATAGRLCPHAVFVRPRFERYKEISLQVRGILDRFSDLIEPLSLDEAYLDVSANPEGLFAEEIARRIRAAIKSEIGITASAGVAPNKMLAKIASELNKPDGLAVIKPHQIAQFMQTLPVKKIHGIGPVSATKLAAAGIVSCGDILQRGRAAMLADFGLRYGSWLYLRATGTDERIVSQSRERKSIGSEQTFFTDLSEPEAMHKELEDIAVGLAASLKKRELAGRTVTLKVRYTDFSIVTRAQTLSAPIADAAQMLAIAKALLDETAAGLRPVRLLGISLSKLSGPGRGDKTASGPVQLRLFAD